METNDSKARILVIEDNPSDVELLRLALAGANVECDLIVIDDGAEALAFVRQQGKYADTPAPELAIVDLNIPKNDGLEILAAMRASSVFAELPVAVLSSSSSPRDRANMEVFRIRQYIPKPPDLDEYMQIGFVVKNLLTESRKRGTATG